jgi:predicted TIM-barrel fold metal-dependent hydrolase
MLRLMMSGLFEKLPTLCIIIGHLGELLPFWAWRIDHRIKREGWDQWAGEHGRPRKLTVTEYLRRNFFVTTSGTFDTDSLKHAVIRLTIHTSRQPRPASGSRPLTSKRRRKKPSHTAMPKKCSGWAN